MSRVPTTQRRTHSGSRGQDASTPPPLFSILVREFSIQFYFIPNPSDEICRSSLGIAAFSRAAYPTPALIAPLSAPAPPQTVYTPCPHSVWARRTPTTARPTLQLPRIFPHRPVCVAAPHIRKTARRSRESPFLFFFLSFSSPYLS
jgi:hypothetical protein